MEVAGAEAASERASVASMNQQLNGGGRGRVRGAGCAQTEPRCESIRFCLIVDILTLSLHSDLRERWCEYLENEAENKATRQNNT